MSRGPGRAVNVTDGALLKPMLVLSLPIIATNLMQVGYNLADTLWIGRLGQAAVVLVLSWIPDVTFIPTVPGATTGGVVVLIVLHATTAAICYASLTR
jgi:Na+-driven multidrug efflux pump